MCILFNPYLKQFRHVHIVLGRRFHVGDAPRHGLGFALGVGHLAQAELVAFVADQHHRDLRDALALNE